MFLFLIKKTSAETPAKLRVKWKHKAYLLIVLESAVMFLFLPHIRTHWHNRRGSLGGLTQNNKKFGVRTHHVVAVKWERRSCLLVPYKKSQAPEVKTTDRV